MLAFLDHFGIADDDPRVNPWGGAIAIGHPLASSGVRLMTQLARQFAEHPEVRYGLTAMCIGIGMGGTVIWENPHCGRGEVSRPEFADEVVTRALLRRCRRTRPGPAGGADHSGQRATTTPSRTRFGPAGLASLDAGHRRGAGRRARRSSR